MRLAGPRLVALALAMAATAAAAPARAADMATPAPSYYPPAVMAPAVYDWSGIYGGGNVGVGLVTDNFSSLTGATTPISDTRLSTAGLVGGPQFGANYEFTPWVIGAEASWTSSAITDSRLTSNGAQYLTTNPQWLGAVTGRIGYAANTLLFYAKGGGAWMHVEYKENTPVDINSYDRTGFTVGVGLEYGMTENLSAKIEYDFYDFGTKDYPAFTATPLAVDSQISTLVVGLNYRFTFAPSGQRLCPTC